MNKLNYEILSAIDNIDSTIMESEMNVMNSLINTYEKSLMILEHCNDNSDVSSYDIFQESVIMEADDNGKKKIDFKKAGKIILNILLWLPRQIMRFIKFIRNKISKSKPLSQETINKAKQSVGDDTILITTTTTNSGGKPEVKVSSQSGDTQKEEEIKKNVESGISSISNNNVTPQQSHSSNVSITSNNNSNTVKANDEPNKTSVKISKDDIIVGYFCHHYDIIKHYQNVFNEMKSLININDFIDIDFTDPEKYDDITTKLLKASQMVVHDDINPREKKSTYAEYVKYFNDTVKIINDVVSSMVEFNKKLEKPINIGIDKMQAMNDNKYEIRIVSIMHDLRRVNEIFFDALTYMNDLGIQWFIDENEKVNKMVESIYQKEIVKEISND